MSIRRKRVNLSVPPYLIEKIREVGRQNGLRSRDGSLENASICTDLVQFICDLHGDATVQKHLEQTGGNLLDLIQRSVKNYIDNE